jgi:hypothetical protein
MCKRPTLEPGQAINLLQWGPLPRTSGFTPPLLIVGARLGEAYVQYILPHGLAFKKDDASRWGVVSAILDGSSSQQQAF